MTPELSSLLARVGTALYSPDSLTRRDADVIYTDVDALVTEVERLRGERAAVVAFLRVKYDRYSAHHAAECIERGEHRREEKP